MAELTATECEEVRRLRVVERLPYREIARRLHRYDGTVAAAAHAMGLPPLDHNLSPPRRAVLVRANARQKELWAAITAERLAALLPLLESGLSWSAAARQLGLTKAQVAGICWRGGICQPRGAAVEPPLRLSEIVERLPRDGCLYIAGNPRDIRSDMHCGAPVTHGWRYLAGGKRVPMPSPYCAEHHALCHVAGKPPLPDRGKWF